MIFNLVSPAKDKVNNVKKNPTNIFSWILFYRYLKIHKNYAL